MSFQHMKSHRLEAFCDNKRTAKPIHFESIKSADGSLILQHGVPRSNCVDCLDRTNVAQFGIGKVAFEFQLYALGYISHLNSLPFESDLCLALETLYDEHGDTLACQYAGSQLVHSIKTYKKTSVFQERRRDVLQTISRYYSNTFGDFEKQDAINLFLGILRPFGGKNWSFGASDHYLHFPPMLPKPNEFLHWAVAVAPNLEGFDELIEDEDTNKWVERKALEGGINLSANIVKLGESSGRSEEDVDDELFDLHYKTFQLTSFDSLLKQQEQLQQRRPLFLSAIDQHPSHGHLFMRMFKSNPHSFDDIPDYKYISNHTSATTPPPSPSGILVSMKGGSIQSSLAAGTASIIRKSEPEIIIGISESYGPENSTTANIPDFVPNRPFSPLQKSSAGELDENVEEANEEDDFRFDEDRNNSGIVFELEPYSKPMSNARTDGSSTPKRQLNLSTGLRSDMYFSATKGSTLADPLPISERDMGIYRRYASVTNNLMEMHIDKHQKQWTFSLKQQKRKQKSSQSQIATQPITPRSSIVSSSGGKMEGIKSVDSKNVPVRRKLSLFSPLGVGGRRSPLTQQPSSAKTAPSTRQSPMRKISTPETKLNSDTSIMPDNESLLRRTFSKLGPMFEFKPAIFTADTSFNVELGDVPEESMEMYRKTVALAAANKKIREADIANGIPINEPFNFDPPLASSRIYEQYKMVASFTK